jgi:hypothetical protein
MVLCRALQDGPVPTVMRCTDRTISRAQLPHLVGRGHGIRSTDAETALGWSKGGSKAIRFQLFDLLIHGRRKVSPLLCRKPHP